MGKKCRSMGQAHHGGEPVPPFPVYSVLRTEDLTQDQTRLVRPLGEVRKGYYGCNYVVWMDGVNQYFIGHVDCKVRLPRSWRVAMLSVFPFGR